MDGTMNNMMGHILRMELIERPIVPSSLASDLERRRDYETAFGQEGAVVLPSYEKHEPLRAASWHACPIRRVACKAQLFAPILNFW